VQPLAAVQLADVQKVPEVQSDAEVQSPEVHVEPEVQPVALVQPVPDVQLLAQVSWARTGVTVETVSTVFRKLSPSFHNFSVMPVSDRTAIWPKTGEF
jgi:hypothetical protein